jgi:hypothetical protein
VKKRTAKPRTKKPAPSLAEAVRAMKLPNLVEVTMPGRAIQILGGLGKKAC